MDTIEVKRLENLIRRLESDQAKLEKTIEALPAAARPRMTPKLAAIVAQIAEARARLEDNLPGPAPVNQKLFLTELPEGTWPPTGSEGLERIDPCPDLVADSADWTVLLHRAKPCRRAYDLIYQLRLRRCALVIERETGCLVMWGPQEARQKYFDPAADFFAEQGIFWDELRRVESADPGEGELF